GMLVFYTASKRYRNRVAIQGTGIDTRTLGGIAVLPGHQNRRYWHKRLSTTPMQPVPAWLDAALERNRPVPNLKPITSRKDVLKPLEPAVTRIIGAPCGEQENTRHAQCFKMGLLIATGVLDYETARRALVAAANAMPVFGSPWGDLESKVEASIERGIQVGG